MRSKVDAMGRSPPVDRSQTDATPSLHHAMLVRHSHSPIASNEPPAGGMASRRAWLRHCGAGALAVATGGCHSELPRRFRVSGPSMSPTLWGPHHPVRCDHCGVAFRIHAGPLAPAGETFPCWHCGQPVRSPRGAAAPGDTVAIQPWSAAGQSLLGDDGLRSSDGRPLRRGALVAVHWQGRLRLKRLFALPGRRVRLDGRRLLVDPGWEGASVSVSPTLLPVDLDAHRAESRWAPAAGGALWHRRDRRWHTSSTAESRARRIPERRSASRWLVYRHVSVYDGGQPAPVRDDYPGNAGLTRQLHPATALVLDLDVQFESEGEVEAVFFTGGKARAMRARGSGWCSFHFDASETTVSGNATEPAPVSATRPVALRLSRGGGVLSRIRLQRHVDYRLRRRDPREPYPLRLAGDECFVLGDNVPVSVDSRHLGPLPIDQIVGTVG